VAGAPWRYKGVTAFRLIDRDARGEDITPFLNAYEPLGFNVLRVFWYTPAKDWGADAWEPTPAAGVCAFLAKTAARGWHVELVLLTEGEPDRLAQARALLDELRTDTPVNLLPEAGNEPTTHKVINTPALRAALDALGLPYSSGDYESIDIEPARNFGAYTCIHTPRDGEWPRKAKDLREFYDGWGPWEEGGEGSGGTKHPAFAGCHRPCVADEPIRPDQAGFVALDFYTYAAVASIMGAGATFHSKTGTHGLVPTADELRCAEAFARGLDVFPADAALGGYGRIDEQGATLRTYTMGNRYMVRIRPQTRTAPEPGWTALDQDGICWQRS